jgi:hypothetical protein
MKEGMAVDQKTEDPNHFDPRYFQGKIWQAADTGNMEKSYVIARDAFAAGGRSIVNATVGGQLEVFPRTTLEEAIGLDRRSFPVPALPASPVQSYPRLLVIDMTATGNGTATGEIKANLLADWPEASFLQIAKHGSAGLSAVRRTEGGFVEREFAAGGEAAKSVEAARAAIDAFSPDIVLYRPTPDTEALHRFAMDEIQRLNKPLVTWIMDDWPARMAAEKPEAWARMKPDLNDLLARSKVRLSICEAMSDAFLKQYAVPFRPLANGIDPADWPGMEKSQRESFVLRYAGGLAADMNRDSVLRIAAAVENLARAGKRIWFEISTHSHWLKQCETLFEPFKATQLAVADKTLAEYRAWLSDADALLIAYNFDEASMRYVRYSMANKMPECLASGAVVLAHGPRDVATIDYLAGVEGAVVVSENSGEAVEKALSALIDSPVRCAELAAKARATAFDRHNIIRLRADLRGILTDAAQRGSGVAHALPELRGNAPLTHFSALLLMDPQAALAKLGSDSALKTTVAAAVAHDATDLQLSEHLKRCLAFAKIDLNKLK